MPNPIPTRLNEPAHESALGVLADLTAEIAKEHPLAVKVDRILTAARRLTQADIGIVGLVDAEWDSMRTFAHQPAAADIGASYPRGDSVGGTILETGQRYRGRYDALPAPKLGIGDHDVAAFPISWDGELLGYIDERYPDIPETIRTTKALSDETSGTLKTAVTAFKAQFKP